MADGEPSAYQGSGCDVCAFSLGAPTRMLVSGRDRGGAKVEAVELIAQTHIRRCTVGGSSRHTRTASWQATYAGPPPPPPRSPPLPRLKRGTIGAERAGGSADCSHGFLTTACFSSSAWSVGRSAVSEASLCALCSPLSARLTVNG